MTHAISALAFRHALYSELIGCDAPPCSSHVVALLAGQQLASDFASLVNSLGVHSPLANRRPSPMLSPTAAVAAQMDALQMNDWPETDAGVATAYAFTRAMDCEQLITGKVYTCKGWGQHAVDHYVHSPRHARVISCVRKCTT